MIGGFRHTRTGRWWAIIVFIPRSDCSEEESACLSKFACIPLGLQCNGMPNCHLADDELCTGTCKNLFWPIDPGVRFCKPERYLWKPLWPKDISAGDIFGPESVSVKIYYGWNTCWATSPNPPGKIVWFGLLGGTASATARVISRRWNDDDEISYLMEETGVPGGNHRPTASNYETFHTYGLCPWKDIFQRCI